MRQMKRRSSAEGVLHHQANPVRVYAECPVQIDRIERARKMVNKALEAIEPGPNKTIVELGCGVLDISGPFSTHHDVVGAECNKGNVIKAMELYPRTAVMWSPIEQLKPFRSDVLILCEILEHLEDPASVVKQWLTKAKACVISHPIGEELDSPTAGGDHQWSYDDGDFANWFSIGGHRLVERTIFQMGSYQIILGYGVRA